MRISSLALVPAIVVLAGSLGAARESGDACPELVQLRPYLVASLSAAPGAAGLSMVEHDVVHSFTQIPTLRLFELAHICPAAVLPFVLLQAKINADAIIASKGENNTPSSQLWSAHLAWNSLANQAIANLKSIPDFELQIWGVEQALKKAEGSLAAVDTILAQSFLLEPVQAARRAASESFNKTGELVPKREFSQTGSDGVLEQIFARLGLLKVPGFFVEFGTQMGNECATRQLRLRYGWDGVYFDSLFANPYINLNREFINTENVNEIFAKHNVPSQFTLLSIDIDGQEEHVWRAIRGFRASVVIIEFNSSIKPPSRFSPVKDDGFQWNGVGLTGSSAQSLVDLANELDYVLVAIHGGDLFFVDREILDSSGASFPNANHLSAMYATYRDSDSELMRATGADWLPKHYGFTD